MMEIQNGKRYEIKMVYENMQRYLVEKWVRTNPFAFRTPFPSRIVNNIYFDTEDLNAYQDHLSGVEARRKLRFRWYGETVEEIRGQLEVKHKQGDTGWKWIQPVESMLDLTTLDWQTIRGKLSAQVDPRINTLLDCARPVMINRYRRDYYVTADNQIRLTLDYDLKSYKQQNHLKPNLTFLNPYLDIVVIEFKCAITHADQMADVLARFPLRVGAYSKYVNGMEAYF
ncbi:MAG: hypothetical protein CL609_18115 [Anaerolineaceae bacterium]|nr:hypothetical protein [Anaerolineaceae bacterium]